MSNATAFNTTLPPDSAAAGIQQVTGQTLLWATFTLALTATSQSSYTASKLQYAGAKLGHGSCVYRVSPICCFVDAWFELCSILGIMKKLRRRPKTTEPPVVHPEQSSHGATDTERGRRSSLDAYELSTVENPESAQGNTRNEHVEERTTSIAESAMVQRTSSSQVSTSGEPGLEPAMNTHRIQTVQPTESGSASSSEPAPSRNATSVFDQTQGPIHQAMLDTMMSVIFMKRLEQGRSDTTENIDKDKKDMVNLYEFMKWSEYAGLEYSSPKLPSSESELLTYIARYEAWDKLRHTHPHSDISTAAYSMKLTLFVLGALPQAIKIFSMRGIALIPTQAAAAVYLAAIIIHGLKSYLVAVHKVDYDPLEHSVSYTTLMTQIWLEWFDYVLYAGRLVEDWQATFSSFSTKYAGDAILQASWSADYAMNAVLWVIILTTPICVYSRYSLTWLTWLPICSSVPNLLMACIKYEGILKPTDWRAWYTFVHFRAGDLRLPLIAPAALASVGFSYLIRWTFSHMHRAQKAKRDNPTRLLQLLNEVVAEESPRVAIDGYLQYGRRYTKAWHEIQYAMCRVIFNHFTPYIKASWCYALLPPDVQWTSYLVFNVLTITIYYTLVFDGSSTEQPAWTYVLG